MSRHVVDVVIGAGSLVEWHVQVETATRSTTVEPRDAYVTFPAALLGRTITGPGIPADTLVVSIERRLGRPDRLTMSKASTLTDESWPALRPLCP